MARGPLHAGLARARGGGGTWRGGDGRAGRPRTGPSGPAAGRGRLLVRRRHADRDELAGAEETRQLAHIPPIGLDPLLRPTRRRSRPAPRLAQASVPPGQGPPRGCWRCCPRRGSALIEALLTSSPTKVGWIDWSTVGDLRMWHLPRPTARMIHEATQAPVSQY
jgi:hypothetical protein